MHETVYVYSLRKKVAVTGQVLSDAVEDARTASTSLTVFVCVDATDRHTAERERV